MGGVKKVFLFFCLAVMIFTACESKKEEPKAAAAAGKPAPEFLAAKLKCMKDATNVEDMEIPVKSLLQSFDLGEWKPVQLDAEAAKKFSVAWEYVMDQGSGKALSYSFGQSKDAPGDVVAYASTNINAGTRTPIDTGSFFAKIKAQAEQLKSSK